jgi:predicted butyrate kinase (DUF1464 family)
MARYAGIDPGTSSFEIFVLEDDEPLVRREISTAEVRDNPDLFSEVLNKVEVDVIAGLSGYGIPVKRFSELKEEEIFLMTLNLDKESAMGLRQLLRISLERNYTIYTVPGVIHLPTVPEHRKFNRIDMGTADKLCSAILGIYQLSEEKTFDEIDFILAESGSGFNSCISVKGGKIVDGVGGTCSFPAFSSMGFIDGELAYLLGDFPKKMLFSGGYKSFLASKGFFVDSIDEVPEEVMVWMAESLLKSVMAAKTSSSSDKVLMSGRNFSSREFNRIFREMAESYGFDCEMLRGFGCAKQSAEGAAIIANGISGGSFSRIIEHAEVMKASGSVLDYLTPDIRKYLRIS